MFKLYEEWISPEKSHAKKKEAPASLYAKYADQVFEHLPKPRETLEELAQTLRPGRILRIAVPNGEGLDRDMRRTDWQASKDALHPLEHINCFTSRTLKTLASCAGLTLLDIPPSRPSQKPGRDTSGDQEVTGTRPLFWDRQKPFAPAQLCAKMTFKNSVIMR